jgi:segregation and condensation protein A
VEFLALDDASAPVDPNGSFRVHLDVFDGPFDLLLSLIAKRRLDVTLIALSQVTDDFIGFIRERGEHWDLDHASGFLVVAATLLDLKVARLLPSAEVEDEEDLARLEAQDLLFARLLQYRAYKAVAGLLRARMDEAALSVPRSVTLEEQFADLLPELVLDIDAKQLAALAQQAAAPRAAPVVDIDHVHAPAVSVREQAAILAARLRGPRSASFRTLISDCASTLEVVARFLALLELYREAAVAFDQLEPLGDLHVRWVATDALAVGSVSDSYDAPATEEA